MTITLTMEEEWELWQEVDRNWQKFAFHYNGPAYRRNDYDNKLAAAFRKFSG